MIPKIPDSMRGDEEYLERAMLRRGITEPPKPGSFLELLMIDSEKFWERVNIEPDSGLADYKDPKDGSEFTD